MLGNINWFTLDQLDKRELNKELNNIIIHRFIPLLIDKHNDKSWYLKIS